MKKAATATSTSFTFSEARDAFLKALTDYQTATRDMSLALSRISSSNTTLYQSLYDVVDRSGSMITRRNWFTCALCTHGGPCPPMLHCGKIAGCSIP